MWIISSKVLEPSSSFFLSFSFQHFNSTQSRKVLGSVILAFTCTGITLSSPSTSELLLNNRIMGGVAPQSTSRENWCITRQHLSPSLVLGRTSATDWNRMSSFSRKNKDWKTLICQIYHPGCWHNVVISSGCFSIVRKGSSSSSIRQDLIHWTVTHLQGCASVSSARLKYQPVLIPSKLKLASPVISLLLFLCLNLWKHHQCFVAKVQPSHLDLCVKPSMDRMGKGQTLVVWVRHNGRRTNRPMRGWECVGNTHNPKHTRLSRSFKNCKLHSQSRSLAVRR